MELAACTKEVSPSHPNQRLSVGSGLGLVNEGQTLRSLADGRGFHIGVAVQARYLKEDDYKELLIAQCNTITPENEMAFDVIHPDLDQYNFTPADTIAAFAQGNNVSLRGRSLVWEQQLPMWLTQGSFSKEELKQILHDHIYSVMGHYQGQVYAWDVVNEAIDTDGLFKNTIWLDGIGLEYIALSFRWAHEADPNALLFYNDSWGKNMDKKFMAVAVLAEGLLKQNVPINGVGIQVNTSIDNPPNPQELSNIINRINALGLKVHITEIDVDINGGHGESTLKQQALIYYQVVNACLTAANCDTLMVGGLTDKYSQQPELAPFLFDKDGNPKPSYYAILSSLSQ